MSEDEHSSSTVTGRVQPELLSRAQIEAEYGIRANHLDKLAHSGDGPVYIKLGPRYVRYRRAAIEEWLDAHEVRNTSAWGLVTNDAKSKKRLSE